MVRMNSTSACGVLLIVFWACSMALYLLPCTASSGAPGAASSRPAPQIERKYAEVWEATKEKVDLREVRRFVQGLQSDELAARQSAYEGLVKRLGMSRSPFDCLVYDPASPGDRRRKAVEDWERYAEALGKAVREKVPLLLQKLNRDNDVIRAEAADCLGSVAHPGFVPLLRAILENADESSHVRTWALYALTAIPHDELIPYLISQIEGDMGYHAYERLNWLTGANVQIEPEGSAWKSEVRKRYEKWWHDEKSTYRYDRRKAFML